MEAKNRGKGKIAALIAGCVAAVAVVTVTVMAVTGFFRSDKAEAFELLSQMPDKLSRSYISEYIGIEQLGKQCAQKGISQNIRISDLHCKKDVFKGALSSKDLSRYVMQLDILSDSSGQKNKMLLGMTKGEDKISAVAYKDEDKSCIAFPELTGKKLLVIDHDLLQDLIGKKWNSDDTNNQEYEDFGRDFRALIQDEFHDLYDEITVTEEDRDKYRLMIPNDAMAAVMADCYRFMSEHQDFTRLLDSVLRTDCLSALKSAESYIRENSSEFTFLVTGKGGNLSQISASVTWQANPFTVTMDFTEREDAKAVIRVETTWKEEKIQFELVMRDREAEIYEESMELHILIGDISFGNLSYSATIDPKENKYDMELALNAVEKEVGRLQAQGHIKNLNPGKSVSYTLDQVSLSVSGEDIFSAAMDLTIGVLEDSIEPPEGEEIILDQREDLQNPECQQFTSELVKNGVPLLMKWGIIDTEKLLQGIQKQGKVQQI